MSLKELREQRLRIHEQMKSLIKKTDEEKRTMTAEEKETFDRMDADINALRVDIDRREKIETEERALAQPSNGGTPAAKPATEDPSENTEQREKKVSQAFNRWIRGGFDNLNPEHRSIMNSRRAVDPETRTVSYTDQTTTTTAGGYLIPQGFSNELEKALMAMGGVRSVARILSTPSGNTIPWPTVNDTANSGEMVAINTEAAAKEVAYGVVNFGAYKFSSKAVRVPLELLQDSFFPIEEHLRDLLVDRVDRILSTYFTTGTGSSQPQGVVNGATLGYTGATGTNVTITNVGLLELIHSVDPAYRANARFMFNDTSLKIIKQLVDGYGRPLWLPSIIGGAPDTVHGYPFTINQSMADMAAAAKSVLFGDFKKFVIRDVMPFSLVRMSEKYIEAGQVAFLAWSRHDSRYINTAAVKYYANGAAS